MSSYTTSGELITILTDEISGLTTTQYQNAVNFALVDTGWAFPPSTSFREEWLKQRAERHCINYKIFSTADKFKVKQYSLDQKFDHWYKVIVKMDKDYETAVADNIAEFANVESHQMFGTLISAGFSYDEFGRDTTFTDDNETIITPEDSD